jgi:hypothetical protein
LTWNFNAQETTVTNNAAPSISAIIACLCCVTFVDGFPAIHYQDAFISAKGDYRGHLAVVLLMHFELLHSFHI